MCEFVCVSVCECVPVCVSVSLCVCQCVHVCLTFCAPWTVAVQAPLSMRFPRQEHWSGFPFPSPGDLPDSGIEPTSLDSPALSGRLFTS